MKKISLTLTFCWWPQPSQSTMIYVLHEKDLGKMRNEHLEVMISPLPSQGQHENPIFQASRFKSTHHHFKYWLHNCNYVPKNNLVMELRLITNSKIPSDLIVAFQGSWIVVRQWPLATCPNDGISIQLLLPGLERTFKVQTIQYNFNI